MAPTGTGWDHRGDRYWAPAKEDYATAAVKKVKFVPPRAQQCQNRTPDLPRRRSARGRTTAGHVASPH